MFNFVNKHKNIILKIQKFLRILITFFLIGFVILIMPMLTYSNYIKTDNVIEILIIFAIISFIYIVIYISTKFFLFDEYIDQSSLNDVKEGEYFLKQKVKEKTCIHEAGHAVIAVLLGIEIESIDVNKTITKTLYYPLLDEKYLRNMVVIRYAGPATEKVLLNRISMGCVGNDGADFNLAEKQIKDLLLISKDYPGYVTCGEQFNEKVNATSTELFNKAEKMVNENKDIINTVAAELLKKEILSGNEVKQIIKNFKE